METKAEQRQVVDEDNRKRYLENHSAYDLVEMISYIIDNKIQSEFRDLVLQFIIDNSIDIE